MNCNCITKPSGRRPEGRASRQALEAIEMGVWFAAIIIDAIAVCGVWALLCWVAGRHVNSSGWRTAARWATIAAPICFVLLLVPTVQILWAGTVVKGTSVPRDGYRGTGPPLPDSAKRITYYSDYGGTDAVFAVSEETFLAWTTEKGWQRKEIQGAEDARLRRLGMERPVTDGILVEERSHPRGTGVRLLFDRAIGLCYYDFASY